MACASTFRSSKMFRQMSTMGWKYAESVNDSTLSERFVGSDSPRHVGGAKRGSTRFARRADASIWQRVASRGRGAAELSAVAAFGRMGAEARAHAPVSVCREGKKKKQAPLPSEMASNRGEGLLVESALGAKKGGAPERSSKWRESADLLVRKFTKSDGDSMGLHRERTRRRHQFLGHYGRWECDDAGADSAVYGPFYAEKL
ncbi:hypothetical protein NDU88_002741 [Pleurodeles waltl]|uniref:Uncharacterized protein n=1 Tax=Pleurodeles waltl TaxID=8319 RepID=A0AAV7LGJ0_PLEWA|nr:hypothetical protein NDU88_002741 [Pleurodeles waltl]